MTPRSRVAAFLAASGVLLLASRTPCAAQTELWRQNPVDSYGGESSQDARNADGPGWFSEVVDNFRARNGWTITEVGFWGGYASPVGKEGNTEGFTIRFYEDENGSPGDRIYEQDVFSFTETLYYVVPEVELAGYEYQLTLPTGFVVPAAGQYWISVVAILPYGDDLDEPLWGWIHAQDVFEPAASQWFLSPGSFARLSADVAFTLAGEADSPRCDCDWNTDGVLNSQDFFDFLSRFFNSDGDFNADGVTNSQDFFDFLNCFFDAC